MDTTFAWAESRNSHELIQEQGPCLSELSFWHFV